MAFTDHYKIKRKLNKANADREYLRQMAEHEHSISLWVPIAIAVAIVFGYYIMGALK